MRFIVKVMAVVTLTLVGQLSYEVVSSINTYTIDPYGTDTTRANAALAAEHQMNSCNTVTRHVLALVMSIPLDGNPS